MNLSNYIDYTLLNPTSTEREIIDFCHEATQNDFYSVCVNSSYIPLVSQLLENTNTKVCSVVGFPLGVTSTVSKVCEAKKAVKDGADEIEMVINLGLLKSKNYVSVLKDITDVKLSIGDIPLKVILEISELNKNEVVKACEICIDANANFIKTCTGFSKSGTTFTAIKIMKKIVRNRIKICAYDGINDYETALKYIDAGVDRIGTNIIIESLNKNTQIRNTKIYKQYIETVQKNKDTSMTNSPQKNIKAQ